MSGIVDSVKTAVGDNVKNFKKQNLKDNIKTGKKGLKGFISEAQSADPGSKYLGTSIMPGVKSEKEVIEDKKKERQIAIESASTNAANAAAEQAEKNKPMPIPSSTAERINARRRAARRGGGRIDTVLSDVLG